MHDVVLDGSRADDIDEVGAALKLASLFRLRPEQARTITKGGKRRRIAKGLPAERARRFANAISKLGIGVEIEPPLPSAPQEPLSLAGEPGFQSTTQPVEPGPKTSPELELAPAAPSARLSVMPEAAGHAPPPPREAASVDVSAGLRWLTVGFEMLKANPLGWIGASALVVFIDTAIALVPVIGSLVSAFALPVLMGGLMLGAQRVYDGGQFEITCVFDCLTHHPMSLALLGVATTLAAILPATAMVGLLFLLGSQPGLWLLGGIAIVVSLPSFTIMMLGTPLIAVGEEPLMRALKLTFVGTYRNILPVLLYVTGSTALLFGGALAFGIGILVALPVVFAGGYAAYRDIYT